MIGVAVVLQCSIYDIEVLLVLTQERASWKAIELAKVMELPLPKLRMGAIYWISQGRQRAYASQCQHDAV